MTANLALPGRRLVSTPYCWKVPVTIVFESVSIAMISLSAFTTTRLRCVGENPLGVIVAVPVQSALIW